MVSVKPNLGLSLMTIEYVSKYKSRPKTLSRFFKPARFFNSVVSEITKSPKISVMLLIFSILKILFSP